MKLRQAQIHHIQSSFATMSNRKDLADLLTYIKKLILGNKAYPIQVRDINFYINERDTDLRYHSFSIPKKNGSARTITAPRGGLKLIQRCVNVMLQQVFQPHPAAMGFVPGRSVQDNATIHIGKKYVYNLDLKDFFHSVDQARVWRCLQNPPFLLSREKRRLTLANVIAGLCCTELPVQRQNEFGEWKEVDRNVLPQGAPTSPTIVNIVAQRLDYKLAALAKRYKVQYSRYADDITFSADYNAFDGEGPLLSKVNKIIDDQSFVVNPVKVRLQKYNVRQEVTGIIVNEKANLPKAYASELRMWLYYWERYGRDRAESYFSQRYTTKGDMAAVLEGKVQYLRAIRGADDALAAKLGGRLKKLKERTSVIAEVMHNDAEAVPYGPEAFTEHVARDIVAEEGFDYVAKDSADLPALPAPEKYIPFHRITKTMAFIRQFGQTCSGFKELVHDTLPDPVILHRILERVRQHPNMINRLTGKTVGRFDYIPKLLQSETASLVEAFEKACAKTNFTIHPFHNDMDYTEKVLKFKQRYRFGPGDEYTDFVRTFLDLAAKLFKDRLPLYNIRFLPDEETFSDRAVFMTWTPNIIEGIFYILQGIRDHSNVRGRKPVPGEKSIEVTAVKFTKGKIRIMILDKDSKAAGLPETLMQQLKRSPCLGENGFRSLCDWRVEADFNAGAYQFTILPENKPEPVRLSKAVGGFKHILEFND